NRTTGFTIPTKPGSSSEAEAMTGTGVFLTGSAFAAAVTARSPDQRSRRTAKMTPRPSSQTLNSNGAGSKPWGGSLPAASIWTGAENFAATGWNAKIDFGRDAGNRRERYAPAIARPAKGSRNF